MLVLNLRFGILPAPVSLPIVKVRQPKTLWQNTQFFGLALPPFDGGIDLVLDFRSPGGLFIRQGIKAVSQTSDLTAGFLRQTIEQRQELLSFLQAENTSTVDLKDLVQKSPPKQKSSSL